MIGDLDKKVVFVQSGYYEDLGSVIEYMAVMTEREAVRRTARHKNEKNVGSAIYDMGNIKAAFDDEAPFRIESYVKVEKKKIPFDMETVNATIVNHFGDYKPSQKFMSIFTNYFYQRLSAFDSEDIDEHLEEDLVYYTLIDVMEGEGLIEEIGEVVEERKGEVLYVRCSCCERIFLEERTRSFKGETKDQCPYCESDELYNFYEGSTKCDPIVERR